MEICFAGYISSATEGKRMVMKREDYFIIFADSIAFIYFNNFLLQWVIKNG